MLLTKDFLRRIGNDLQYGGLVLSNANEVYILPVPEEEESIRDALIYKSIRLIESNQFEKVIRQTDIVETEIKNGNQKIIVRKSQRQLDNRVTWEVFRRDNFTCRYCGRDDIPMTYDHVMLWEDGGPNTVENGITACKKCNKTRGNTPFADWLESNYYMKMSKNLTIFQISDNELARVALECNKIKPRKFSKSR